MERFRHNLEKTVGPELCQKVLDSLVPETDLTIRTPVDFSEMPPLRFTGLTEEEVLACIHGPVRSLAVRLAPILRRAVQGKPELAKEVEAIFQDFNIPDWPPQLTE